jgi:hypothetical protein
MRAGSKKTQESLPLVRVHREPVGIRITIWVGIDEDKIPISQQQINIPRMTSLSHLANQNAPEETEHRRDPH